MRDNNRETDQNRIGHCAGAYQHARFGAERRRLRRRRFDGDWNHDRFIDGDDGFIDGNDDRKST